MNKPKDKKPKKSQSPFDFCPKHNVFFASCKCLQKKPKVEEEEIVPLEDNQE